MVRADPSRSTTVKARPSMRYSACHSITSSAGDSRMGIGKESPPRARQAAVRSRGSSIHASPVEVEKKTICPSLTAQVRIASAARCMARASAMKLASPPCSTWTDVSNALMKFSLSVDHAHWFLALNPVEPVKRRLAAADGRQRDRAVRGDDDVSLHPAAPDVVRAKLQRATAKTQATEQVGHGELVRFAVVQRRGLPRPGIGERQHGKDEHEPESSPFDDVFGVLVLIVRLELQLQASTKFCRVRRGQYLMFEKAKRNDNAGLQQVLADYSIIFGHSWYWLMPLL